MQGCFRSPTSGLHADQIKQQASEQQQEHVYASALLAPLLDVNFHQYFLFAHINANSSAGMFSISCGWHTFFPVPFFHFTQKYQHSIT
jgi:hypothetical protein